MTSSHATSPTAPAGGLVHIARRVASVPRDKWQGLRPTSVQVYLENRCHLRCLHCYESEHSHPPERGLTVEDYDALFGELAALGGLFVTFTGGEMFLRKDALDVVAVARKHRFAVTLYTSGTLIDAAKADRIRDLKVSEVHISLYSHDASLHDAFTRSPGSHARSLHALALLRERGVRTVLKASVLRINIDHLDELIALAASLGADIQLDPTVRARMDGDRAPIELGVSPQEIMRKILVRPDLSPAFRKHAAEEFCTGERSILDGDDVMCSAGRQTLSVGADGSLSACGYFPIPAGQWRSARDGTEATSVADIWLGSPQLDAVREMTFGGMSDCPTCEVKSTCNPCMAYGLVEHGDIGACNSASRHGATAMRKLATLKARANQKMSHGPPLPIVGDTHLPVAIARQQRSLLHSEP